ncbi:MULTISPECIES: GyrI-like domain-containing protein [Microbacterium]|uniref:GyrI-like domain-containing protein n=1 Tax=Microbacterium TaxID=33882 RepID=UPI00051A03FE|nr:MULTISPECIES: GyrI-like domain-containing protein [Microbacterium]MCE7480416.1 GyrI-like domain-containing protein [Microbacterium profundi]
MPGKVDFKKTIDAYRARKGRFDVIDVPELNYLMIDGHGDPNTSPEFTTAVEALYPLAYTLKFTSKRELDRDYTVMPLEGLWWADDHAAFTAARDKSQWDWTLMIMQPEWIDHELVADAVATAAAKNQEGRVHEVRFGSYAEGRCVQTLHVGAFDEEAPLLAEMHDVFIPRNGLRMTGKHHEIYFSDPRKGAPERRRTILRQPVAAA